MDGSAGGGQRSFILYNCISSRAEQGRKENHPKECDTIIDDRQTEQQQGRDRCVAVGQQLRVVGLLTINT